MAVGKKVRTTDINIYASCVTVPFHDVYWWVDDSEVLIVADKDLETRAVFKEWSSVSIKKKDTKRRVI